MFELMFEPIEFVGLRRDKSGNETDENILLTKLMKAILNGTVDTALAKYFFAENRLKLFSYAMPYSASPLAIAYRRDSVEYGAVDESDYFLRPLNWKLWTAFGIITSISYLINHETVKFISLKFIMQLFCFLHAFLSTGYSASMRADFVAMTVPRIPYKSLEALAEGIYENEIRLLTGNSHKIIMNQLENSKRSGWQMLSRALQNRPIIDTHLNMEYKCKRLVNEEGLIILDSGGNYYHICKKQLTLMHMESLVDEPVAWSAPIFSKHSAYIEKVNRITQFLAVEHLKRERKTKILPVESKILSANCKAITVSDLHKYFKYYAGSLAAVMVVFCAEMMIAKV